MAKRDTEKEQEPEEADEDVEDSEDEGDDDDDEDDKEDEDDDDEFSEEHKAVMKQYNEQLKALHEEMDAAGRCMVQVGGVSEDVKSLQDVDKQIAFLTITDAQAKFVERFMQQLARIAIGKVQAAARKKAWGEVWQRLVAILLALCNVDHWLEDTEEPSENNKLLKRIGTQLEKLLATKDEGKWPAAERDFEACKAAIQIVNEHVAGFETGDEPGYKLPVKGVGTQKRGRN